MIFALVELFFELIYILNKLVYKNQIKQIPNNIKNYHHQHLQNAFLQSFTDQ